MYCDLWRKVLSFHRRCSYQVGGYGMDICWGVHRESWVHLGFNAISGWLESVWSELAEDHRMSVCG